MQVTVAPVRDGVGIESERVIDVLYPDDTHGRIFFRVGRDGACVVDFSWWAGPGEVRVLTPNGEVAFWPARPATS